MRRIDASFDQIVQAAITEARATDICVLLRPYASDGTPRWLGIAEGILFGSGRSVLIAPEDLSGCHGIEHVLIAWNVSREAAHAVAEAMPFLKQAREITAIMVDPEPGEVGYLRGARLARHLEHHGIKLGIRVVHTHGLKVSEILLREVARSDADLMVMGGYGHTRLREWVLGGATATCSTARRFRYFSPTESRRLSPSDGQQAFCSSHWRDVSHEHARMACWTSPL